MFSCDSPNSRFCIHSPGSCAKGHNAPTVITVKAAALRPGETIVGLAGVTGEFVVDSITLFGGDGVRILCDGGDRVTWCHVNEEVTIKDRAAIENYTPPDDTTPANDYPEMDAYRATGIAEGFVEPVDQDEVVEAWQYLHSTGLAYRLQGFFGRTAQNLLAQGVIS